MLLGIRPENVVLGGQYTFTVDLVEHLGQYSLIHGALEGNRIIIKVPGWQKFGQKDEIKVGFRGEKICFFDKENGKNIGGYQNA